MRTMAGDENAYRTVIVEQWNNKPAKVSIAGPYSKLSTARGVLTNNLRYRGSTVIDSYIEKAETAWTRVEDPLP